MSNKTLKRHAERCTTHHHACDCREWKLLELLAMTEPIIEKWASAAEFVEWHHRVYELVGETYPSYVVKEANMANKKATDK